MVYGHDKIVTTGAQWLCIEDIYQKLHRPNLYDIGGTYIKHVFVKDFWFQFKTEVLSQMFLMHIFIKTYQDKSFTVGLSYDNKMITETNGIAYLPKELNEFNFKDVPAKKLTYLITYNFPLIDVEQLNGKKLYIHVKLRSSYNIHSDLITQAQSAHDLGQLLDDPVCSDFTIESSDGHKFQVHKLILATQSMVFNAMLKEDTAESLNNHVKLVDVNKKDLQSLLEFVYTGTVRDIANCNFVNLLILADRYYLKGLYVLAEYALGEQLSMLTAPEILVLGDMYNSSYLKNSAMKFIKNNPSVLQTNSWKEMTNTELIREVCEFLGKKF